MTFSLNILFNIVAYVGSINQDVQGSFMWVTQVIQFGCITYLRGFNTYILELLNVPFFLNRKSSHPVKTAFPPKNNSKPVQTPHTVHAGWHAQTFICWLMRTAPVYLMTLMFETAARHNRNQPSNERPVRRFPCRDVCFMINIEARYLLHCHIASSSCGPRVKQHGESWDVITQSVCAILIKTLLTVLHYWNTPHRTLLHTLNKLAPAP